MPAIDYVAEALRRAGKSSESAAEEQMNASDPLPEGPRPLMRELPSADPFPVEALGPVLAPAARAIHDRVQASMALCGQSVLAAATLVVQAHADVELPIGSKRAKPLSSYFVTIAETGERKTEADYHALWAIRKYEKNLRDKYDAKRLEYENDKEAYEIARRGAKEKAKGNRLAAKAELDKVGAAPIPPLAPMLTSTEPTFEGLTKQFHNHHPSLGIFASEGGQFIGGHAMNEENKLRTASGLSELWDAGEARRVRAGDGASIPGAKGCPAFDGAARRGHHSLCRPITPGPGASLTRPCISTGERGRDSASEARAAGNGSSLTRVWRASAPDS